MATTDIGRAVPLLRGEYDPAQTYELNDIVSLNGSLYWHYSHELTTNVAPQATSTWKVVLSLTDAEAYIARAESAAEEAESAKDDAVTAKTAAETASTTATGASEAATAAKDDAVTARNAAQTAETGAVEAKNAAVSAKEAAQSAASSAGTSATSAGNSAGTAEYYATNAETAAETATTKASEASASASTASSAATTATEAKNTAVSSASTATTKAGEASTSATSAASSAAAAQAVKDSIPQDYSALSEDVSDLKTQLNYFDGSFKKFHVNANAAHSSTLDKIPVDIKSEEEFVISFNRNYTNTVQFYAFDSNNTLVGSALWTTTQKGGFKTFTASDDIASIGMTVSVGTNADDYSFSVSYANSEFQNYKNANNIEELTKRTDPLVLMSYQEADDFSGWRKGTLNATGTITNTNNGSISSVDEFTIDATATILENCRAVLAFYTEEKAYIGKVGANGSINQTSGDWKYFTGVVNVLDYAPNNAKWYQLGLTPTDETTISDDVSAQSYAESHCEIKLSRLMQVCDAVEQITEPVDINLVDENNLLGIDLARMDSEGYYVFSAANAHTKYNSESFPHKPFKENTQYTFSAIIKQSGTSDKSGLFVQFIHSDNSKASLTIPGGVESPTQYHLTSAPNKTVSKLVFSYGNAFSVYVKDMMVVEGTTVPAEFISYDAISAVDMISRLETNAKITRLESIVADIAVDIPPIKDISVGANKAHSSTIDQLPLVLNAGDKYIVYVEDPNNLDGRTAVLYEYANGTGTSKSVLRTNTFYEFTTENGFDHLGLTIGVGSTDVSCRFCACKYSIFESVLCDAIQEATVIAKNSDTEIRTVHFHMNAGAGHSSQNDQIYFNVKAGEPFYVLALGLGTRYGVAYCYNDDGNISIENIFDNKLTEIVVNDDYTRVGLAIGAVAGADAADITFMAFGKDTVYGAIYSQYNKEFKEKLLNAKRKANSGNYSTLTSPDIFAIAHFSDIHNNGWAMRQIQHFKDDFDGYINDVICTGDMVQDKISDGMNFWNAYSDGKILTCIGNHDSLGDNGWSNPVSQQTLYETYIEPYKDNWDAEIVENHSYYYKDYDSNKIRLIVLDGTIYDSTEQANQMTWFASALTGAANKDFAVVGAIHFPPMQSQKVESNFTNLLHNISGAGLVDFAWHLYDTQFLDAVDNFINNENGNFVCWLSGHTHNDIVSYDSRYLKQLFVTISCAMPSATFEERTRNMSDNSGLILNVVAVDTVRKYVKLLRYGAEWDDCLRHTGTCVIKYDANPPTVMFEN